MSRSGETAIAIGASMGGLLAARVLSDHFDRVLILERDQFPAGAIARKGVPQGRHAHALLAAGREALERLFPGFTDDMVGQGAVFADISRARWFDGGDYHARCTGIKALLVSRPTLETLVRNRVMNLPNVHSAERCKVEAPVVEEGGGRVIGVRARRGDAKEDEIIGGDLVVDATGRGSKTPAWLEAMGLAAPTETAIRIGLGYSTRIYRRGPSDLGGDAAVVVVPSPSARRGAVMLAIEDDRWILTLMGMLGDHPPTDPEAFQAFARSLPSPDIGNFVADAEPLTDPQPFKYPASTRRGYERVPAFPDGYVVFGDAICSFNPIYGQGMSVSALQAEVLDAALADGPRDLALRFFGRAAKVLDTPWSIAVGGDLRYPTVEGPRTPFVRFINWYVGRLHRAAHHDPRLALAFQRVSQMLDPPLSLLAPRNAWRILHGNLLGSRAEHSRPDGYTSGSTPASPVSAVPSPGPRSKR